MGNLLTTKTSSVDPGKSMEKWYVSKALLTALVLTTLLGFLAYLFLPAPQSKRLGLVIFLTGGALVLVRGIIKITMGMRKQREEE